MKQWKPPSRLERAVYMLMLLQMILGVIYGVLFGPYLGVEILLYFGCVVLTVGFVFFFLGPYELGKKGGASKGASCVFALVLVDSGVYAVVRHPQALGFKLLMSASVLISQHWLSAILGVPMIVYAYVSMRKEEQSNIEKFGDAYKRYMQKVPRMNFVLGFIRLLRRRKEQ
ncbi:isoprenylcysteine carboxylmethyltransferase family protein [Candidatus Bathyarchaeota archaeon]|nr:isoprenylcysteine carboxylmethyltransferase family protein [Candidatus Bathyarchaeota archaeon]